MPGILWIASYPKSGNTWFRAFLANYLLDAAEPVSLGELPKFIAGDHRKTEYEHFLGKSIAGLSDKELSGIRPKVHQWLAESQENTTLVKTHNACIFVDGQPLITPAATAGAIYIVRNPLDVAVSFSHHFQVSLERAVQILCEKNKSLPPSAGNLEVHLDSWSGHVRSWLEAPGMRLHLLRYEDMAENAETTFAALISYLQLPMHEERLRKAVAFSAFDSLKSQEDRHGFVEARSDGKSRFFREGKAGSWKDVLSHDQVRRLIECHRPMMMRLGYLRKTGEP